MTRTMPSRESRSRPFTALMIGLLSIIIVPARSAEPLRPGDTVTGRLGHPTPALVFALDAAPGRYVQGELAGAGLGIDLDLVDGAGRPMRRLLDRALGESSFRFIMPPDGQALRISTRDAGTATVSLRLDHVLDAKPAIAPDRNPAQPIMSPTIASLADSLAHGGDAAAFWQKVEVSGTPLAEPHGTDEFIITFLVRGAQGNARVMGGPTADHEWLTRLGASDVWYRSFVVPRGTRLGYRIAVDIPDIPGSARDRRTAILATARADPLNHHPWPKDAPDPFNQESILELPGAAPEPGVLEGQMARNETRRLIFTSPSLGNQREILLYTPPGFDPAAPDAVLLLLFDGRKYADLVGVPAMLDNLIGQHRLPPMAAAFIENAGMKARADELPGSALFAEAMAREVLPLVRDELGFHPPADRTILAGSSYGGLAALRIALAHPRAFGNVLSMSGSFWWGPGDGTTKGKSHTASAVQSVGLQPIRIVLTAGLFERGRGGEQGILASNRELREVLRDRGYNVSYREYPTAHGYLGWRGALGDGLIALFGLPPG